MDREREKHRLWSSSLSKSHDQNGKRNSGGFLLEPAIITPPRHYRRVRHEVTEEDLEGQMLLQNPLGLTSALQPTRRESSLISQQTSDRSGTARASSTGTHADLADTTTLPSSEDHNQLGSMTSQAMAEINNRHHVDPRGPGASPATVLGSDSARIINLALNLNEARRRSNTYDRLAPSNLGDNRRSVSGLSPAMEQSSPQWKGPRIPVAEESGRQASLGGRRGQGRSSTRTNASPHVSNSMVHADDRALARGPSDPTARKVFSFGDEHDFEFHFSKATLTRAESARTQFELAAEYRRLIQFLQPISLVHESPHGKSSLTSISSTSSRVVPRSSERISLARPYNPLQALRDRKIRRRKRQPLDPAPEAWSDLEVVKVWVDQVEDEVKNSMSLGSNGVHVPPFPPSTLDTAALEEISPSVVPAMGHIMSGWQGREPWFIPPEELLADAYWLEQSNHKTLVEDQERVRIRGATHNLSSTARRAKRKTHPEEQRTDSKVNHNSGVKAWRERSHGSRSAPGSTDLRDDHRKRHGLHKSLDAQTRGFGDTKNFDMNHSTRSNTFESTSSPEPPGKSEDTMEKWELYHGEGHAKDVANIDDVRLKKQMLTLLTKGAEGERLVDRATPAEKLPDIPTLLNGKRSGDTVRSSRSNPQDGQQTSPSTTRSPKINPSQSKASSATQVSSLSVNPGSVTSSADASITPIKQTFGLDNPRVSSESARAFVPSIAMSLSPPVSRRASPTRNRTANIKTTAASKSAGSILEQQDIEASDFAIDGGLGELRKRKTDPGPSGHTVQDSKLNDLARDHLTSSDHRHHDNGQPVAAHSDGRTTSQLRPGGSRIRGVLKSIRVDGLRKEVYKLGHLMWKREESGNAPRVSSPPSSRRPSTSSASGVLRPDEHDTQGEASVNVGVEDLDEGLSRATTNSEFSRYRSGFLPTFVSANAGMGSLRNFRLGPGEDRAAAQSSSRGQSRLGRHDASQSVGSVSDFASPRMSRITTRDSNFSYGDSRRSSIGRVERSRSPAENGSRALQPTKGRLGLISSAPVSTDTRISRFPVTGLTNLEESGQQRQRGSVALVEWQQIEASKESQVSLARPTRQELARARALFFSSGVKAQEIVRRAQEEEKIPRSLLQNVETLQPPVAPRKKQHLIAAQFLMKAIDQTTRGFERSADEFSNSRLPDLMNQTSALREHVSSDLITRVRALHDDADAFSTEITTTHTLAIKQVNDNIELAMRRRRRRLRWLRRGGYVLLEWLLLGLMWWVWLVFVLVRLVRGSIRAVFMAIRWGLWL